MIIYNNIFIFLTEISYYCSFFRYLYGRNSIIASVISMLVTRKKRISSRGMLNTLIPVVCDGSKSQMPCPIETESAKEKYNVMIREGIRINDKFPRIFLRPAII